MGKVFNFKDYYKPISVSNKRYKNNIIDFNTYKNLDENINKTEPEFEFTEEDAKEYRYLELWDWFFDYVGQDLYDRIQNGEAISQKELDSWGCENTQEFLATWRGNSEEEFSRWLKENGYEL